MMQFSIFHSLAERKINDLVKILNEDLKPKEHYKLISADEIKGNLILLTATKEKDIVLNIVDFNGDIPPDSIANWRSISTVIKELGKDAPEPLFRMRIFEINQELRMQDKNIEEINNFWKEIFANQK